MGRLLRSFLWGISAFNICYWGLSIFDIDILVRFLIGIVAMILVQILVGVLYTPRQRDYVPPAETRPHLPSLPDPYPPYEDKYRPPLEVVSLNFIIRGVEGNRMGNRVFDHDIGIRPYAELYVHDEGVIGKEALLRFKIQSPRRRTRYDWKLDIPFTLEKGLNRVWPQDEEFPIAGHYRQLGSWQLELDLVGEDDYSSLLEETTFLIKSSYERPIQIGADASISRREVNAIAEDRGVQTVDDVLEDW